MQEHISSINIIDENDRVVASAIAFHLILFNCKNCLVSTSSYFISFNIALNIACGFLIFGNYARIIFFNRVLRRCPISVVCILSFLFAFCLVSQVRNSDLLTSTVYPYNYVRETFLDFLSYCLPCFLFCSMLQNPHSLLYELYRGAWLLFVISVVSFFLYINNHSSAYEYSMGYAKALGFSIFVFLFLFYEKRKTCYIVASAILLTFLVLCGSRGPLLQIGTLLFMYLLFLKGSLKIYVIKFLVIGTTIFLTIQLNSIALFFINFLERFGIQSRTLMKVSIGSATYDSGRSRYFAKVFDALNESPVLGLGAFGGSVQVGLTHNLYLDIWANFGYFAGSALMIFLFYSLIKIYRLEPSYSLVILFFSMIVFPRGFTGFDFWGSKELWILFGLMVSYYSRLQSRAVFG